MVQRHGAGRFVRSLILACVTWTAVSASAQQGKATLVEPPAPLLPQQVGDWTRIADAQVPAETDARLATVLNEDGLKREERGVYREGTSGPQVGVTAREFIDATGAHAAFSYYERPGSIYRGKGLGSETDQTADTYLYRSGVSLVRATGGRGPKVETLLEGLTTGLPKVGGPKGIAPLLPTYLPPKGLDHGSVKYALGPVSYEAMGGILPSGILGFDKAAEAVTARYNGRGWLTILTYPTPQIAGDRLRAIESEVKGKEHLGTVVLRRQGPLVMMTSGSWPPGEAKELVAGIHPKAELTWNKEMPPEFHAEIHKTYSLLSGILIFCGFGALAAIILGLFLGGGRAGIRLLQGKPAAAEPEFLRIDLSGKAQQIRPGETVPKA